MWQERTPNIIITDIGMPGEDGFDFIRRLRKTETAKGMRTTPAVALTAYARPEDRSKALAAGYQQHLPKPVEPSELWIVLSSLDLPSEPEIVRIELPAR